MDYAVVLYFDHNTDNRIKTIIDHIVENGCNSYMHDHKIPPHVTVGFFISDNEQNMIDVLEENISRINPGKIAFSDIGMFLPSVIYISPVLNEYLASLNWVVNELYQNVAISGDDGHYNPYNWVPHIALGTKMKQDEMEKALQVVQHEFKPFEGIASRIALARCNPFKEIKEWGL